MIDAALAASDRRVVLVDGFNVLHAILEREEREAGWWRRAHRERLLRRLARWPDPSDALWIAFDGAKPAWSSWAEPVAQVVSDGGATSDRGAASPARPDGPYLHSVFVQSADDWIVSRARRAAEPARTIVVSRDRQVAGRSRSAGCEVWTPWELLARCGDERVEGPGPMDGIAEDVSEAWEPSARSGQSPKASS